MFGIQDIGKTITFKADNNQVKKGTLVSAQFNGIIDVREKVTGKVHYGMLTDNILNANMHEPIQMTQSIVEIINPSHHQHGNRYVVIETYPLGEIGYLDEQGIYRTISEDDCFVAGTIEDAKNDQLLSYGNQKLKGEFK